MTTREVRDYLNTLTDDNVLDSDMYIWCLPCDNEYPVEKITLNNRHDICYVTTEMIV